MTLDQLNFYSKVKKMMKDPAFIWELNYKTCLLFIKEKGYIPSRLEKYMNLDVGTWFRQQQMDINTLELTSSEKIVLINKISQEHLTIQQKKKSNPESFNIKNKKYVTRKIDIFYGRLSILENFIMEHHRLPIVTDLYQNFCIGAWMKKVHKRYDMKLIPENVYSDFLKIVGLAEPDKTTQSAD
jgi:hypothetical protein